MNKKFLLCALMLAGLTARAQNVMPVAVCAEYYTDPVVGGIGVNYPTSPHHTIPYPFGDASAKGFIAHYAYLSTEAQPFSTPYGLVFGNFFSPGPQVISNDQPQLFYPGASPDFRGAQGFLTENWFLDGNRALLTPIGVLNDGVIVPPSPTCKPAWEPSTALTYSQPGTYPGQYLGQVDSGPPAGATFAVTAAGSSTVTLSNLTYIPNDTANPSGTVNPNSIYGDVVISGSSHGSTAVELQLTVNGKVAMLGMISISY